MAKRLIDADALKQKATPHYFDNCCYAVSVEDIDDAPTVDAAPVVRCRECKKRSPSVTDVKDAVWCRELMAYMPADGFCSYGERKEK